MDTILASIGDTIGDIINSPPVQVGTRLIFIYIVILWIATAYWAFRDMQQRSDNAILPYVVAAGIILGAKLLAHLLRRLSPSHWQRTGIYGYPTPAERDLRWMARNVVHELQHHLHDVDRLIAAQDE